MIIEKYEEMEQEATRKRVPLSARPLDMLYFAFFISHIPASLLMDFQAFYPPSLVPTFISQLPKLYVQMSGDPLIGPALGYMGDASGLGWFYNFLTLELVFQFPVFLLGLRGLYNGSKGIYPLLLIYGASTATTTLPCLTLILSTPITSTATIAKGLISVTPSQRLMLLNSYVPFFLVPLLITVDMGWRLAGLVKSGVKAQEDAKRK